MARIKDIPGAIAAYYGDQKVWEKGPAFTVWAEDVLLGSTYPDDHGVTLADSRGNMVGLNDLLAREEGNVFVIINGKISAVPVEDVVTDPRSVYLDFYAPHGLSGNPYEIAKIVIIK